MSDEQDQRRRRVVDDIENLVDEVNKVVRVAVVRASEAAESVSGSLKDTIKDSISTVRDSVVMVRVDKESLTRLDDLVEASVAGSRSEAAAYLISEGVKARQELFDKIAEKLQEIRTAKEELRRVVKDDDNT